MRVTVITPSKHYIGLLRLCLAASFMIRFSTGMFFVAASWSILKLTQDGSSVALLLIISTLPGIVLWPVIGAVVDGHGKRATAAAVSAFRSICMLTIFSLHGLSSLEPWHLYLLTFGNALGEEIHNPNWRALVREIVPAEELLNANAKAAIVAQTGLVLGAGLSGLLLTVSLGLSYLAMGLLFGASCILFRWMGVDVAQHSKITNAEVLPRFYDRFLDGTKYIKQHPELISPYINLLLLQFVLKSLNALLAPFVGESLNGDAFSYGIIDASFAAGAVLGGWILPRLQERVSEYYMMVFGLSGLAGSLVLFTQTSGVVAASLCYGGAGLFFQSYISFMTAAQHRTAPDFQGRVHSAFNALVAVLGLGTYTLIGLVAQHYGYRLSYFFLAIVALSGIIPLVLESSKKNKGLVR